MKNKNLKPKSLEYGAFQVVQNCLKIRKSDKIVIITDKAAKKIINAIINEINPITKNFKIFVMEEIGQRPKNGKNPIIFPKFLEEELHNANVSIYAADGFQGELKSFRKPMTLAISNNPNIRHAHMIGITKKIMEQGMSVDYAKVQKLTSKIKKIVDKGRNIRVVSPSGSDFRVELHPKHKWIKCDGIIRKGEWSNLPDGEIFTSPKNVEGIAIIDGVLGDYFTSKYGPLKTHIIWKMEKGRIVEVLCKNKKLLKDFEKYIKQDANANRIGEIAIGTNIGLTKLIGNMLQDEKFPGWHMATGNPYPEKTGAKWDSSAHCDGVILKPTIVVDKKIIMRAGKFII
ncbi:MAG: aminopeptidase [Nanoarchaeota archaeon]